MGKPDQKPGKLAGDLYVRLEAEVRTPKRPLLLDAFLPPPATIPSAFAPVRPAIPPEDPAAGTVPGEAGSSISQVLGRLAPDEGPSEEPAEPPKRRRPVRRTEERQKSLEEEIAEFMSRDNSALAPDRDPN
jgi:hypothetical protein